MRKKPFNFSVEEVMKAQFRPAFRGYHQQDVDEFLDHVVEDYATYDKEITRLNEEIEQLKKGYGYK